MANFNFNKVILGGRLTADPELKTTPSGVSVTTFTIAVNRKYSGGKEEAQTDFLNVTAWRQTAEFITRYFRKASSICITGSLQTRSWTDQSGQKRFATEIVADEVTFVDSKSEAPAPQNYGQPALPRGYEQPQNQNYGLPQMQSAQQLEQLGANDELPF